MDIEADEQCTGNGEKEARQHMKPLRGTIHSTQRACRPEVVCAVPLRPEASSAKTNPAGLETLVRAPSFPHTSFVFRAGVCGPGWGG